MVPSHAEAIRRGLRRANIVRAAERENIAASALSKRLSNLEASTKRELIIRRNKGLELTAAGQALLHHAPTIMRDVAQMDSEVRMSDLSRTVAAPAASAIDIVLVREAAGCGETIKLRIKSPVSRRLAP